MPKTHSCHALSTWLFFLRFAATNRIVSLSTTEKEREKNMTRIVRPHNLVAQKLLEAGDAFVSTNSLVNWMTTEPRFADYTCDLRNKLSGLITGIKVFEHGIIQVAKDGRATIAYKLVNQDQFNAAGHACSAEELSVIRAARKAKHDAKKRAAPNPYTSFEVVADDVLTDAIEATEAQQTSDESTESEVVGELLSADNEALDAEFVADLAAAAPSEVTADEDVSVPEVAFTPVAHKRDRKAERAARAAKLADESAETVSDADESAAA
jgi:hypothetical protein